LHRALALCASILCVSGIRAATFDLDGLAPYRPEHKQLGVIRIHGSQLTIRLIHRWEEDFIARHPDIRYRENLLPSWFSGLCARTEDLTVMGHEAWHPDLLAFHECFGREPLEILFATGGFDQDKPGNTPGVVMMVNRANPISSLTLAQLDGILGAERTGGWKGTQWSTASARGPEADIRTWDRLGLGGDWSGRKIHVYGTDATQSLWAGTIQRVVFGGGTKWNPALREMVRGDHVRGNSDVQTVAAVAADPYAIGFGFMRVIAANPGVKPLAIAWREGEAPVAPTAASFRDRSYPLVTGLYIYLDREPGKPLPPRLREFLTYVLSREGQQRIAEDGMYLPLTPELAREQLRKLQ
jgi:phosphate transport system substrate-binding protein